MPNTSYPGVYIQEKAGGPAPIQGVSPSAFALVGYTERGPVNTPTLITSMTEFFKTFGQFTSSGLCPTMAHAFFKNGGQLLWMNRVLGAASAAAKAYLSDPVVDEDTTFDGDNSDTTFTLTAVDPIEPGTLAHSYWHRDTPIAAEALAVGDGTVGPFADTLAGAPLEPGTVVVTDALTQETFTDGGNGTLTGDAGGSGTINYLTGALSVTYNGTLATSTVRNAAYTPMLQKTGLGATDAGALNGTGWSGTVDYETGVITATYATAPSAIYPLAASGPAQSLLISYSKVLWQFNMKWPGLFGNDFKIKIEGQNGFEADATATFTRWKVSVVETDANGDDQVLESFEDLDLDTSGSAAFLPTVMNDTAAGSAYVTAVDVGNTGAPAALTGTLTSAEVLGAGDGVLTQFTGTLAAGDCHETTLAITAQTGLSVTDDGNGNLIGNVNPSGNNTINYDTGAFDVTFSSPPDNVTNVLATYYAASASTEVEDAFEGGLDGSALTASDVVGATLEPLDQGLYALNKTDEMLMVGVPDFAGNATVDQALIDWCAARKTAFAILSTPTGLTVQQAVNHKKRTINRNSSSYGAVYHPWVSVLDPVKEKALLVPPIGHVAGVYARTDNAKNVGKAPAGPSDGKLAFALGLAVDLTRAQVGVLTQARVNAIVNWPQVGQIAVWGARTLEVGGEFGYIQARRLFMFLEKSIFDATHVYVFESNGSSLWARVRLQLSGFLLRLFGQGYFAGNTPEEAFFVIVDSTNNPQVEIDVGNLNVDVGVAPNKPAEFVIISFKQKQPG